MLKRGHLIQWNCNSFTTFNTSLAFFFFFFGQFKFILGYENVALPERYEFIFYTLIILPLRVQRFVCFLEQWEKQFLKTWSLVNLSSIQGFLWFCNWLPESSCFKKWHQFVVISAQHFSHFIAKINELPPDENSYFHFLLVIWVCYGVSSDAQTPLSPDSLGGVSCLPCPAQRSPPCWTCLKHLA